MNVQRLDSRQGRNFDVVLEEPRTEYMPEFDLIDHFRVNRAPFMTLAFRRKLFVYESLMVDEYISVCEDWDLLLHPSRLTDVTDLGSMTAFYGCWTNSETSYSTHSRIELKRQNNV